jgi:hypothetical protein
MMAGADLIPYGVGVVGSGLAMTTMIVAHRDGTCDHGVRLLASGLTCWSAGVALQGIAPLMGDIATVLGSLFLLATLTYIDANTTDVRRQITRQAAVAAAATGLLIAVYLSARLLPIETPWGVEMDGMAVRLSRSMVLACTAFTMVKILTYARRLHRGDAFPMLLIGLRVTIAGVAVTGMAWAMCELVEVWTNSAGNVATIANQLAGIAILIACVGGSVTRRASAWVSRRHRTRTRRSLDAVTPLWTLLVEVVPEIVLTWDPDERDDDVDVLCRRVIEIRDAQLRLRSYIDPEMQAKLEGILKRCHSRRGVTRAVGEAVELVVAIAAVDDGRPTVSTAASPIGRVQDRDWRLGYRDLVAEAEQLGEVAKAMRDPRIQAIRRHTSRH